MTIEARPLYRVEADFSFLIHENVPGERGLDPAGVEELIERNWWWISGSTDVLLESSWQLKTFEELPPESN
jgi:hypothetical protein